MNYGYFGWNTRRMTLTHWVPTLIVMAVIFVLSSQSYEQQSIKTQLTLAVHRTILNDYLSSIQIHYGSLTIDGYKDGPGGVLEFILRKLAHVIEYFLLSITLLRGIRCTTKLRLSNAIMITVLISVSFAITDEIHQLYSIDRGSRPQDIVIDSLGVLIGILAYGLVAKRKKRRLVNTYRTEGL
ncbi:VanZ family protein [Paenibacillus radicis (ex Xue et al. 2023)]|uniref:VanZ family protein n=1 Tax=Paenibacillus radicis (ex Xue et al. 2023) TaxID=2972489 RepID=A0ABT1YRV5_9BACL|nr:VanZ family protein [Paenibacillus radicis (ex Xue et al. 2023)]MCR8635912.1 VanZ family protein [Paenibacillus radicis (ex Xue et al. 2023)]